MTTTQNPTHITVDSMLRVGIFMVFFLCLSGMGQHVFAQEPVWHIADQKTNRDEENTTVSVDSPDNISSGDLIIIIVTTQRSGDNNGDPALGFYNLPTGFNLIATASDLTNHNRPEIAAFYKIATASEPATYTFNVYDYGDDPDWQIISGRVTGHDPSNPIGVNSTVHSSNNQVSEITVPAMNTSQNESLVIGGRAVRTNEDNISTDPGSWSLIYAKDGEVDGDQDDEYPGFHVVERDFPTAGSTGNLKFDWTNETARAAALMFEVQKLMCSPDIGDPVFTLGANSSRCLGAGNVTYTATEANETSISYSLEGPTLAAGNTINSSTGEVAYVAGWQDTAYITATASGCGGPTTAMHKAYTRGSVGDPFFVVGSSSGRCIDNEARSYGATATDADSIVYSLDATSISNGASIIPSLGSVTFPGTYAGTSTVTATAYGCGGTSTATHTIVTGTQALVDDYVNTGQNQTVVIDVLLNDRCDIDTSSITVTSGPTSGSISVNTTTGEITYTSSGVFTGVDSLTYEICGVENPAVCSRAKVYINVSSTFTDDYFNQPATNCFKTLDPIPVFDVAEKYQTANNAALYCSPMVADLDGDGDVEIIGVASDNLQTASPRSSKNLRIYDGATGATQYTITCPYMGYDGSTPVAMADLDDDGDIEIIVASLHSRNAAADQIYLFCYDHLGTQLWKSDEPYANNTPGDGSGGNVGIADFNGDGIPEVYVYNEIYNALTGVKLADGGNNGFGLYKVHITVEQSVVAAAELTTSPGLELAAGRTVYEVNITNTNGTIGNTMTAINYSGGSTAAYDGYTGLADLDLDGELDVVVAANNGDIYAWNPRTNTTIASRPSGTTNLLGPLFIGDVDGSGTPNIGYCRRNAVDMLEYDGTTTFNLKWSLGTSDGSGETSLTMFDFDQDGTQEIVYRDETDLRIIDGSGASAVNTVTIPASSSTGNEGPIVADIDNDGQAEIIVTSEGATGDGDRISMIEVFESVTYDWAPARKVWNQFAYFNVHINDDYTIPTNQPNHSTEYFDNPDGCPTTFQYRPLNNFNVQSTVYANNGCPVTYLPDAEVLVDGIFFDEPVNELTITYSVLNRAEGMALPVGTDITFYKGNPYDSAATVLTTVQTTAALNPVTQQDGNSILLSGINALDYIFIVINDDGATPGPIELPTTDIEECNYANNPVGFEVSSNSVLGVELLAFDALKQNEDVLVYWETSIEVDNDFFVLQRSADGKHFENLEKFRGAGTSLEANYYEYLDREPLNGINYYRLFQQDFDGSYAYSNIIDIHYSNKHFAVYPNPANENAFILNPFGNGSYTVIDMMGKIMTQGELSKSKEQLNVQDFPAGVYAIQLYSKETGEGAVIQLQVK